MFILPIIKHKLHPPLWQVIAIQKYIKFVRLNRNNFYNVKKGEKARLIKPHSYKGDIVKE